MKKKRHKPGCTGKMKHPDKRVALAALRNMNNAQMEAYRCRHCKGWHIGRTAGRLMLRIDQLLAGPAPRLKKKKT